MEQRMKRDLCVIGLGYIGLPSAVLFAQAGLSVLGVDVDRRKLDALQRRECPIHEHELPERLAQAFESGNLEISDQPTEANAFLLCLPTPVTEDRKADLTFVEAAARSIAPVLKRGDLVILESTVPPNTCRDVVAPILLRETGLDPIHDYLLAHAPERVIPGAIFHELIHNVRIVGGMTVEATEAAAQLFLRAGVMDVRRTTAEVAELSKVVENTFRDVNIALANELSAICERLGVDVFQVIQLANLHPRVNVHSPGIGVGGHCIPVDPWFLIHLCPDEAQLIRTARQINDAKPHAVVQKILATHGPGNISPIGILGVTYKANVEDTRESPALEVIRLLQRSHRDLRIFDPFAPSHSTATLDEIKGLATIAILTDHTEFLAISGPHVLRWNGN
jgi:UDP-N-acetyl-D-mannosaminuronic acid dehydrogenase